MSKSSPGFDATSLIDVARAATGLNDFGDEDLPRRVQALVEAYRAAGLRPDDEPTASRTLAAMLEKRLRFTEDRREHPEIDHERVEQPFIVIGFPRAGTTLLHSLLVEDPANRGPQWWQVMHPSPPPGLAGPDDERIRLGHQEVSAFCAVCPGLKVAHPYFGHGAHMLMECESFLTFDFRNSYPFELFQVPVALGDLQLSDDGLGTYAFHRALLQHLQWDGPTRRWVLKGTRHQGNIADVLATYPDAVLIWPHRDPVTLFASVMELVSVMTEGLSRGPVDRRIIGPAFLEGYRAALDAALASREIDDSRVVHLNYADVMRDHVGVVRGLYERFDINYTDEFEFRMRDWMASPQNGPDRFGKFRYSLDSFGLTAHDIESRFADYIERFEIPCDRR
jgi:hypothetical protein